MYRGVLFASQRRPVALPAVVAVAAGAAGVFGWEAQRKGQEARQALHTADSLKLRADTAAIRALRAESTAVKARDSLALAAIALTRSKKEAEHARDTAVAEKRRADTLKVAQIKMSSEFCSDQLRTINSFEAGRCRTH